MKNERCSDLVRDLVKFLSSEDYTDEDVARAVCWIYGFHIESLLRDVENEELLKTLQAGVMANIEMGCEAHEAAQEQLEEQLSRLPN